MSDEMRNAAAIMGKKGGSAKTKKKQASSRINGKDQRPHILKCEHFESVFPHELVSNEWKDKFPMVLNGRPTTYNPDYYCPALHSYIEVSTSKPNISEQGPKWRQAIADGLNLLVFWWDGTDITEQFKGGRAVTKAEVVKIFGVL